MITENGVRISGAGWAREDIILPLAYAASLGIADQPDDPDPGPRAPIALTMARACRLGLLAEEAPLAGAG